MADNATLVLLRAGTASPPATTCPGCDGCRRAWHPGSIAAAPAPPVHRRCLPDPPRPSTKRKLDDRRNERIAQGFSLHRYQIDGVLGAGGFGITYRAVHEALENEVAIKEYFQPNGRTATIMARPSAPTPGQIPAKSGEPPSYDWGLQRFLDEAKILVQINHPAWCACATTSRPMAAPTSSWSSRKGSR